MALGCEIRSCGGGNGHTHWCAKRHEIMYRKFPFREKHVLYSAYRICDDDDGDDDDGDDDGENIRLCWLIAHHAQKSAVYFVAAAHVCNVRACAHIIITLPPAQIHVRIHFRHTAARSGVRARYCVLCGCESECVMCVCVRCAGDCVEKLQDVR